MAEKIKTLTEKYAIEKVVKTFFSKSQLLFKTAEGDFKVRFMGYANELVALKMPNLKNVKESHLLFFRTENSIIQCHLLFHEQQEDDMYLFQIIKVQIIERDHADAAKTQAVPERSNQGKTVVYVTNFISDFVVQQYLTINAKKVDKVKEIILYDMRQSFNFVKLFFINEDINDTRMDYIRKHRTPLFIPNMQDQDIDGPDEVKYKFYIKDIYSKDTVLQSRRDLISETAVPLLYKTKLPIGYIQINNTTPVTEATIAVVKRFVSLADELFEKNKIFPLAEDKLLVSNISKESFSLIFIDKKYTAYFKDNCYLYCEMLLPNNKKATILTKVRGISFPDNKKIKIECDILEIDPAGKLLYESLVDSLDQEKT